jgi:hypothetical protein
VDDCAFAATEEAVTSPPKSETELIVAEALAVALEPAEADAEPEIEPVLAALPYEKPPAKPTVSGGAETETAEPPAWPGTNTLIPNAFAEAPGPAD